MKAIGIGLVFGLASGALTHGLLALVRNRADEVFYGVWAAGVLVRLVAVAAAFFYLVRRAEPAVGAAMVGVILGQIGVQMVPIRSRFGFKRPVQA